ncbi:hypothetical protein D3C85_292900 [compost metagenome]
MKKNESILTADDISVMILLIDKLWSKQEVLTKTELNLLDKLEEIRERIEKMKEK